MSATATSRARAGIAVLAGVIAVGLIAPPAWAQAAVSLADVARKEEERRKTVAAPAKVYTNKDLNAVPAGSPPTPSASASTKPADDAPKTAEGDAKGKDSKAAEADAKAPARDQQYWAARLKNLQDRLVRDQDYADAMQTRINALTTDFSSRDDPAQRAVIGQNRQKSIAELARLTKSVQDTKKAIADLLEEARHAGVPPGWLR
jgi:hypothetical protein